MTIKNLNQRLNENNLPKILERAKRYNPNFDGNGVFPSVYRELANYVSKAGETAYKSGELEITQNNEFNLSSDNSLYKTCMNYSVLKDHFVLGAISGQVFEELFNKPLEARDMSDFNIDNYSAEPMPYSGQDLLDAINDDTF